MRTKRTERPFPEFDEAELDLLKERANRAAIAALRDKTGGTPRPVTVWGFIDDVVRGNAFQSEASVQWAWDIKAEVDRELRKMRTPHA